MDKKAQTTETYDQTAEQMAQKFRNLGARVEDIERGFSFIKKDQPSVLEIGCGDGRDAKEICKKTSRYLGIDISKSMVRVATQFAPEAKFEVADIDTYKFPENIDLIFSFASLLHSDRESIRQILARAHSSLNGNGIFYISLKFDRYQAKTKTDEFGTRTYYFYTPDDIKELAGDTYEVVWEDIQDLRGQKWFTIVLRKA